MSGYRCGQFSVEVPRTDGVQPGGQLIGEVPFFKGQDPVGMTDHMGVG